MKHVTICTVVFFCVASITAALKLKELENYEDIIKLSQSAGSKYLSDLEELERHLIDNDIYVKEGTHAHRLALFKQPSKEATAINRQALKSIAEARDIQERLKLISEDWNNESGLFQHLASRQMRSTCPAPPFCIPSKYRTITGSCNNLNKTYLGQARTPLNRILPAAYSDGFSAPRRAKDGSELPSPRLVSTNITVNSASPNRALTLAVMQWGQFLDHDLDSIPVNTLGGGFPISCCKNGKMLPPELQHPQCMPIELPEDDYFFKPLGRNCMNFVRSAIGARPDCTVGPADQLNDVSHWVDASHIYGTNLRKSNSLRAFFDGRMAVFHENGRDLLPISDVCDTGDCYMAGDGRVKDQSLLTVMHTIWLREHNRIADQLTNDNFLTWDEEKVFQEARRIVIAEFQHITYNEWLPVIIGPFFAEYYGLLSSSHGYFTDYDPKVNPTISNEFATAGFRFGHSMIPGFIKMYDENGAEIPKLSYNISNSFADAQSIRNDPKWYDAAIRALYNQPIENVDPSFTTEITNRMFSAKTTNPFGFDLVALNVQRGRDHGLPGYPAYRGLYGLRQPKTFDDLKSYMPAEVADAFAKLYKSVDDIDLYVAGMSEAHILGSSLGPVFTHILIDQFSALKRGDRFWYELGGQPHSFTPEQLNSIRNVTLARILCDNNDGSIGSIQRWVFLMPDPKTNPRVPCYSLPSVDLSLFNSN